MIPPQWWAALASLGLVLIVAGLWGIFGRIATKVQGNGMILEMGGFRDVVSLSSGVIEYLNVREGMVVDEGATLGVVSLPLDRLELGIVRRKVDFLRQEVEELQALAKGVHGERGVYYDRVMTDNKAILLKLSNFLDRLTTIAGKMEDLARRGVTTELESLKMLQDTLQASMDVSRKQEEGLKTGLERSDQNLNFRREFRERSRLLMESEFELLSRLGHYMNASRIVSPSHGIVVNIQKGPGDKVDAGDVLLFVKPVQDDALRVKAFIPAAHGKDVRQGQTVYVSPANIAPQRYGYLLGVVDRVGTYPVTFEHLAYLFKNQDLARTFEGQDVVVEVEVSLIPDPGNPTGFRWSGKAPENAFIRPGTLCEISCITERRAPASYILPWVRENLLGQGRAMATGRRPASR